MENVINIENEARLIASNCTTCKEVSDKFSYLVATFGKENAINIQAIAKGIVKDSKLATKTDCNDTIAYLKSNNIAKVAFKDYCNNSEDRHFAKILLYSVFGGDIDALILKYAKFRTESVILNRYTIKNDLGDFVRYEYKPKNIDSVIGYLSALKTAIKNAKNCAIGYSYDKVVNLISEDSVNWE